MCAIMGYTGSLLSYETFMQGFEKTTSRGPDMSRVVPAGEGWMAFHRLAIMGLHEEGMQPFSQNGQITGGIFSTFGKRRRREHPGSLAASVTK